MAAVAVRIDVSAFRESLPAGVVAAAERLRREGGVGALEAVGGGARAVVRDGDAAVLPWVGVVERAFASECDCGGDLCAHAVAVALSAFDEEVRFSGAGVPHGDEPGYRRAVRRLAPGELADLVVEHAARDRHFAALLLGRAGLLDPEGEPALADFRDAVGEASRATTGEWEIADLEQAGRLLAGEVEILLAWPATAEALDLVEEAIEVWDELAGHLVDARRDDAGEVGDVLVGAHRDLRGRLALDPEEIEERLTRLAGGCEFTSIA